jgi:hypothetical protein
MPEFDSLTQVVVRFPENLPNSTIAMRRGFALRGAPAVGASSSTNAESRMPNQMDRLDCPARDI